MRTPKTAVRQQAIGLSASQTTVSWSSCGFASKCKPPSVIRPKRCSGGLLAAGLISRRLFESRGKEHKTLHRVVAKAVRERRVFLALLPSGEHDNQSSMTDALDSWIAVQDARLEAQKARLDAQGTANAKPKASAALPLPQPQTREHPTPQPRLQQPIAPASHSVDGGTPHLLPPTYLLQIWGTLSLYGLKSS